MTTVVAPRQVDGLEKAYEEIKELNQQVKMLAERLAKVEKAAEADKKVFVSAVEDAMRKIKRKA